MHRPLLKETEDVLERAASVSAKSMFRTFYRVADAPYTCPEGFVLEAAKQHAEIEFPGIPVYVDMRKWDDRIHNLGFEPELRPSYLRYFVIVHIDL